MEKRENLIRDRQRLSPARCFGVEGGAEVGACGQVLDERGEVPPGQIGADLVEGPAAFEEVSAEGAGQAGVAPDESSEGLDSPTEMPLSLAQWAPMALSWAVVIFATRGWSFFGV